MNTAVSIFNSQLPAYATNAKSKAMQSMAGGLAGGGFGNRISLRGSRFRFIQNGEDVGAADTPTLDVVIFAMSEHVQRTFYKGAYDPNSKEPPTCYSLNGKAPEADSPERQATQCAICPQNVKGSGRQGNTKACAYKKRVVVLSPDDLEGPMYALDVNAMSMFGEQSPAANKFSFKGYFEKLMAHNLDVAALVTRLTFDDDASVPKLHFSPLRVLGEDEFAQVQARVDDEEIGKMLNDVSNVAETGPEAVEQFETPKATTPAPAPKAQPAAPAHQGVGGLVSDAPKRGFGVKTAAAATKVPAAVVAPKVQATKPISLDLDALVNFDDDTH